MVTVQNQTVSFLINRFRNAGITLVRRHGQNFLIDLNLQRLIVDAAELEPADVVLEVGTGTGALTALLAERVSAVVSVEIDRRLYQMARDEIGQLGNVTLLCQDALKNKNHLHPDLIAAVSEVLAQHAPARLKLVANLPFNAATPLLTTLLVSPIVPHSMTVTIQKELADRMVAQPGTKDYGALSIWIQSQCRVAVVRVLPPTVFWPQPKVTSAVIHLEVDPILRDRIADLPFFQHFVRSMFFHRRKFLRRQLMTAVGDRFSKDEVDQMLARLALDPESRAEQLTVEQMLELADAVRTATEARPV